MNSSKDVALRMFAAMQTRQLDDVGEYIDADFVHPETAQWCPEPGPKRFEANVRWLHETFTGVGLNVIKMAEQGDQLYVYLVMSGLHTGNLLGMGPSGRFFFQEQLHVIEVRDGMAVHHQEWRNNLTALRQLGLAEPAGPGC